MLRLPAPSILLFLGLFMAACEAIKSDASNEVASTIETTIATEAALATPLCDSVNGLHLSGQFDPSGDPAFQEIPALYTPKSRIFLHRKTLAAFERMWQAASAEGIHLVILSATRNWTYQRGIWNRKWTSSRYENFEGADRAIEILKYSSMPGSSRHHWGTDIDLNAFENEWFTQDAVGIDTYQWLIEHGPQFGFHQVYGDQTNGRRGYREEKWHWSYLPLASIYLDCYLENIPFDVFNGFNGAQFSDSVRIIEDYVKGIDALKR